MAARTFIAVDLDEPVRDRLAEAVRDLLTPDSRVRWVARDSLHVTLKFLGDLDDTLLADVCQTVRQVVATLEPADFAVRGVECIPPAGRTLRMFWAGIEDTSGGLARAHATLEPALASLGLPPDQRRFRPHVTLGRVRSARNADRLRQAAGRWRDEAFGDLRASEIVVYGSERTPSGPIYTPLTKAPLTG
jgi:2'-5' RNA ligase